MSLIYMMTIEGFTPMKGCAGICPIEVKEKELGSEICCMGGARQCCFFCMDLECPIKEEYRELIRAYDGVLDLEEDED